MYNSAILHVLWSFVCDVLKSRHRLQAEHHFLRHQLNIALRSYRLGDSNTNLELSKLNSRWNDRKS